MYSEALAILDHNTELYMINELQNTVKEKDSIIAEKDAIITALQKQLEDLKSQNMK